MLKRKIEIRLEKWLETSYAILVDGARQVGKTYILKQFAKEHFENFIYLNLYENKHAAQVLREAESSEDFLFRLTSLVNRPFVPGKTVIFLDEIQELKDFDIVTTVKFLVDAGQYRYMLSGSMLGVELYDIKSWPVGYLVYETMHPLDFEEFLWANGVNQNVIDRVKECFENRTPIEDFLHKKMMDLFTRYLLVGGMPDAVNAYVESQDLNRVALAHSAIYKLNRKDVAKYAAEEKRLKIKEIYDLIPSELNTQTKRFRLKDIEDAKRGDLVPESFLWLQQAGVAIPTYTVANPELPLRITSDRTVLKLFMNDTGLLTYALSDSTVKRRLLAGDTAINYGSIYENIAADLLVSHGFENLYYYNSKRNGEVDFLVEYRGCVLPIEIKSGKDYKRHSALTRLLSVAEYQIPQALVFCDENLSQKGKIFYLPIYMLEFLRRE